MALVMTSGPALEPITLAEAKAHLRVDTAADDLLITSLITTSRLHIETALSLALITQTWSYFVDTIPASDIIPLPLAPVAALTAIRLYAPDDSVTTLPLACVQLDAASTPPRLIRRSSFQSGALRRANAIEFGLTAGFGPAPGDVPAPIRQALLLLVAHWYEHRDPAEIGQAGTQIPAVISQLLGAWHAPRLT